MDKRIGTHIVMNTCTSDRRINQNETCNESIMLRKHLYTYKSLQTVLDTRPGFINVLNVRRPKYYHQNTWNLKNYIYISCT